MQEIDLSSASPSSPSVPVQAKPLEPVASHPLLACTGCPTSSNGALLYIKHFVRGCQAGHQLGISDALEGWIEEAKAVLHRLGTSIPTPHASASAQDLNLHPWGSVHSCIESSRKASTRSTAHLDALFSLAAISAASSGTKVNDSFLQGLRMCYLALSGKKKQHPDWLQIAVAPCTSITEIDSVVSGLSSQSTRSFASALAALLAQASPAVESINRMQTTTGPSVSPAHLNSDIEHEKLTPFGRVDAPAHTDEFQDQLSVGPQETRDDEKAFRQGDSLIEWHQGRSAFADRNDQLALLSWQALPAELTCHIAKQLGELLLQPNVPDFDTAIVAVLSLLTSTPARVIVHSKLGATNDVHIDLERRSFGWPLSALRDKSSKQMTSEDEHLVRVPFPTALDGALRELEARERHQQGPVQFLSDLLGLGSHTEALRSFLRRVHELLKRLGDPGLQAFPVRWSRSISRVYISEGNSPLFASFCSLDLSVSAVGARSYLHPAPQEIFHLAQKVFFRLGLGEVNQAAPLTKKVGICSDNQLKHGFHRMAEETAELQAALKLDLPLSTKVEKYNQLVVHTAALLVFSIAGRGSRIEEVTWGAALCRPDLLWIEDKKVAHENGSRILPKIPRLHDALVQLSTATQLIAALVAATLPRHTGDVWREQAGGTFRFDALLFQKIVLKSGQPDRQPVVAADVESVAQEYFGKGKNFMRHVVITTWAIEGKDPSLVQLITGHAMAGLEVPSAGSVYSPRSAVEHAGKMLDKLLERWMPTPKSGSRAPTLVRFKALPGRRAHKVHQAHRQSLLEGGAPTFSRWHLAAEAIVLRVRDLLLLGQGPASPLARLWLHLLCFDGLHEVADLKKVFQDLKLALALGGAGWTVQLRREGASYPLVVGLTPPTSVLVSGFKDALLSAPTCSNESIEREADEWLKRAMPDCWTGDAESKNLTQCLLACFALWGDLIVPSALQFCYAPSSHAAVLDPVSNRKYFKLEGAPEAMGIETAKAPSSKRRSAISDPLESFFKQIDRLGNTSLQVGELKQRAADFDQFFEDRGDQFEGHFVELLIEAVQHNNQLIRAGKKNRLKFSSLSTYFSNLKPILRRLSMLKPSDFDEIEWREFAHNLAEHADSHPPEVQGPREAANWLLKTLSDIGHPVPRCLDVLKSRSRIAPAAPTAIGCVSSIELEGARSLLGAWHINDGLLKTKTQLALDLLAVLPLRWGELACLSASDSLQSKRCICIQPSGFGHIKSYRSTRILELDGATLGQLSELGLRLQKSGRQVGTERFLFAEHRDEVIDTNAADGIHMDITSAIKYVTKNPNFRVHALRARCISNIVFPGWFELTSTATKDAAGPLRLKTYFEYAHDKAWRSDHARIGAGHASLQTTLSFYLNCWLPMRGASLRSTLSLHRPTDFLLTALGVTRHGLIKHDARHPEDSGDPWIFVSRHLERRQEQLSVEEAHTTPVAKPIAITTPDDSNVAPLNQPSGERTVERAQYLAMRLAGLERAEVVDTLLCSEMDSTQFLEPLLTTTRHTSKELRGRIKGDLSGRAMRADKERLLSPEALAFLDLLQKMPIECLDDLLRVLIPNQCSLDWAEALHRLSPAFGESSFVLEYVTDLKHVDPKINHMLSKCNGLACGAPGHDIGRLPRVFVVPANKAHRNTVAKARLTTMARLLCCSLRLLKASAM